VDCKKQAWTPVDERNHPRREPLLTGVLKGRYKDDAFSMLALNMNWKVQ
jgi:hypothetical protein